MKRFLSLIAAFCVLATCAPAAFAGDSPSIFGFAYQNTTTPGDGFVGVTPSKQGSAQCKNIFYIVALGDCSVRKAMKNGGISQLSHYDVNRRNIMGFQIITTKAYGR